jgi:hypothetical protein
LVPASSYGVAMSLWSPGVQVRPSRVLNGSEPWALVGRRRAPHGRLRADPSPNWNPRQAGPASGARRVTTSLPSLLPTHHNTQHPMSLQVNGIIRAQAALSEKSEYGCLSLRHCTCMVPKGSSEAVIQGEMWSVAYITRMCPSRPRSSSLDDLFRKCHFVSPTKRALALVCTP